MVDGPIQTVPGPVEYVDKVVPGPIQTVEKVVEVPIPGPVQ